MRCSAKRRNKSVSSWFLLDAKRRDATAGERDPIPNKQTKAARRKTTRSYLAQYPRCFPPQLSIKEDSRYAGRTLDTNWEQWQVLNPLQVCSSSFYCLLNNRLIYLHYCFSMILDKVRIGWAGKKYGLYQPKPKAQPQVKTGSIFKDDDDEPQDVRSQLTRERERIRREQKVTSRPVFAV